MLENSSEGFAEFQKILSTLKAAAASVVVDARYRDDFAVRIFFLSQQTEKHWVLAHPIHWDAQLLQRTTANPKIEAMPNGDFFWLQKCSKAINALEQALQWGRDLSIPEAELAGLKNLLMQAGG